MQKRVLAIHDISCVGRCSLTVALPILSTGGLNTGVLPTAILSTHTGGFEGFTYRDLTDDIPLIENHFKSLDLKFDIIYSGFLGSIQQIEKVSSLAEVCKNSNGMIVIDPVMADNGKLYSVFDKNFPSQMKKLCALADVITPNLTEAALLLDETYKENGYNRIEIDSMLKKLHLQGPKLIVITGVSFDKDKIGVAAYDGHNIEYYFSEKIDDIFHGTGDIFCSAFICALSKNKTLKQSIKIAVDFTYTCVLNSSNLEKRYGVAFELELPKLIESLK